MNSQGLAEPLLVGRDRELKELRRYLKLASEGQGKTVFISAEAGVGKTRLLQEFVDSEKLKGNTIVLSGWCLFNAGVPYFPFIEAFTNYNLTLGEKSEKEELELNSWLKNPAIAVKSNKLEYLSPQALKDQTFSVVANTIKAITCQKRVILTLEDIHWADSASLALLHYLARVAKDSERLLILATFRSEELTHDSEGYPNKLVETLSIMRREDLFVQINLLNLDPTCVIKMAENMLRGRLQQVLAEKLVDKSEGNPLFVVESIRLLKEHKDIAKKNNEWYLIVDELRIPNKLKDIVLHRLACLNYAQRRLLDAACVIGDTFEVGLLSAITNQDNLDVMDILNEIAHSTSLICADESRYRFDHARSREIIYEALDTPLKKEYHGRIAEKLEKTTVRGFPVSDIAYHYIQAGNKNKAIKFSLSAAKDELAKWSNAQAIKNFQYVLQNAPQGQSDFVNQRTSALEGIGDAYYANNMFKESMRTFEELAQTSNAEIPKLRAYRKASECAFQLGDVANILELIKKAEPYAALSQLEKGRVLMIKARAFIMQNKVADALNFSKEALLIFEEEYSLWDVAFASIEVGLIAAFMGEPQKGLDLILRSVSIFEDLQDFRWQMEATYGAGEAFNACLLEQESLKMYEKAIKIDETLKMGDYHRLVWAKAGLAWTLEDCGDYRHALVYSLKALEDSKKTDSDLVHGVVYSNLARQYALLGDAKPSETFFKKLLELPQKILQHPLTHVMRAKAIFYTGKKQWEQSNQSFNELFAYIKQAQKSNTYDDVAAKANYAWALKKQRRFKEARTQYNENKEAHQKAKEKFNHLCIHAYLMAPKRATLGQTFEARLIIVNTSKISPKLTRIEELLGSRQLTLLSPEIAPNGAIDLGNEQLGSFQVKTIKFNLQANEPGEFTFTAKVICIDNLKKTVTCTANKVCITADTDAAISEIGVSGPQRFMCKNDFSPIVLDFLIEAFLDDRNVKGLPLDECGWRTLMQVVKEGRVSKHVMYGRSGGGGAVTSELTRLGLVESRFFFKERGRTGRVLKLRASQKE